MPVGKPPSSRTDSSERRLVQAAQQDAARFADLYEAHFDAVYAFVVRRVRDRAHAEDLTSDVFHKALAALPNFDWRGVPFGAWLFRIAANVVADHWKRSAREANDPPELYTEQEFEKAGDCARLFRMVDTLPKDQQRVIRMRFSEGHSIREIASLLKKSDGAVKQLQFRALANLRAHLTGKKSGIRHG